MARMRRRRLVPRALLAAAVSVAALVAGFAVPAATGPAPGRAQAPEPTEVVGAGVELPGKASTLAFSPDGRLLASGSGEGEVKLWDVATRAAARTVKARGPVESVAFSTDGKALAYVSKDRVVLLDLGTGQETRSLTGSHPVVFSPDGALLAFGNKGASGDIKLWEVGTAKPERKLRGHVNPVTSLSFSPDGRLLASGGNDDTARIWDPATGTQLQQFRGGSAFIGSPRHPEPGMIGTTPPAEGVGPTS